MSAVQSFLSTFTQISPVLDTLGWKIFVMKKPAGCTDHARVRVVQAHQTCTAGEGLQTPFAAWSPWRPALRSSGTFGGRCGEVLPQLQAHPEDAAIVRGPGCGWQALHISLGIANTLGHARRVRSAVRSGAPARGCAMRPAREMPFVRRRWHSTSKSQCLPPPEVRLVRQRPWASQREVGTCADLARYTPPECLPCLRH